MRYLYQDSRPYQVTHRYEQLNEVTVPGAQMVAAGGTAQILQLPPC